MFYSKIKYFSSVNGSGIRTALFVSGCSIHCKGCFNQAAWDFNAGALLTDEKINEILKSIDHEWNAGLSILGGEPLDPKNQFGVLAVIRAFRERFGDSKSIWVWTGYVLDESIPSTKWTDEILESIDVLIDGEFVAELRDNNLQWTGSSNQRVIRNPWWVKSKQNQNKIKLKLNSN